MYKTYAELLHRLTQIDLRLFAGFLTVQVLATGFVLSQIARNQLDDWEFFGILGMDGAAAYIAMMLISRNFKRRFEATKSIARLNIALGLERKGLFIDGEKIRYVLPIRKERKYVVRLKTFLQSPLRFLANLIWEPYEEKVDLPDIRPWAPIYYTGIILGFFGFVAVLIPRYAG